jgi:peptidoglycan/LPS O-acetylase OafA/YrhL
MRETIEKSNSSTKTRSFEGVKLSQSGSLVLDIIRFAAAVAVLAHHLCDSRLGSQWLNLGTVGYHAVCVFFVLSGFVIRFITITRSNSFAEYAIDRASRIYSVVIPAIAFTLVCEAISGAVHRPLYELLWSPFLWHQVPVQLLTNLTFMAQCWGYNTPPLSNVPFWSLSYEVIYYAVYGLISYRVRGAWLWSTLILFIAGPNIAVLGLTWLLGAFAADLYLYLRSVRRNIAISLGLSLVTLLALLAVRYPIMRIIHDAGHDQRINWMTATIAHWNFLPSSIRAYPVPWISQISPSFGILALVMAVLLPLILLVLDRFHPALPPPITRWTRWVANSTFTLYLFHVPAMMLIVVLIGHPLKSAMAGVLLGAVVIVGAIYLSVYLDNLKDAMRSGLRRLLRLSDRPVLTVAPTATLPTQR